jgi:hypothetical protein
MGEYKIMQSIPYDELLRGTTLVKSHANPLAQNRKGVRCTLKANQSNWIFKS